MKCTSKFSSNSIYELIDEDIKTDTASALDQYNYLA